MNSKSQFGMWIFLVGELMLFGTLILLFELNCSENPAAFKSGSKELHFSNGTVNTFLLLSSSYFVALAQAKQKHILLLGAAGLGLLFLAVKGTEYYDLYPAYQLLTHPGKKLFYTFYGFITLLHGLHVLAGVLLLLLAFKSQDDEYRENTGLYWHLVDLVWVFLYPMFYLLGH